MPEPFFTVPVGPKFALRNVTAPRCLLAVRDGETSELCRIDLVVEHGVIAAIEPAGTLRSERGPDLDGSMILPGLIDWPIRIWTKGTSGRVNRIPAVIRTVPGNATAEDRESRWTADDVRRRMDFGLATAYSHGVVAIRTHLDSLAPQAAISFRVFCEARDRWAGRIDLQASSIAPLDLFLGDAGRALADNVAESGGQLGCATSFRAIENVPLPARIRYRHNQPVRPRTRTGARRGPSCG